MVVHITQDLMMSSNASAASRAAGHKFKFVASWERAAHVINENEVEVLIIDLQSEGLDIDELVEGLKDLAESNRPQTIAYAQHVEGALLEKANAAGFDKVMTRGQAHQALPELLKS